MAEEFNELLKSYLESQAADGRHNFFSIQIRPVHPQELRAHL
jgi:hypothetical protein